MTAMYLLATLAGDYGAVKIVRTEYLIYIHCTTHSYFPLFQAPSLVL